MTRQLAARLIIDLAMTVLLLCALAYRITGDASHEWIGVSVCVFFIIHNVINWRWYKNIFKGAYTMRRIVMTAVNLSLALTMAALITTGLLQSRTVLAFLHLPGGMALRQIHTTAAYWGLLLIAVHIGLHWGMFINAARNMTRINTKNRERTMIIRFFAFLIVIIGVWWSFDRDMFSKLFQGFSFDYWDEERPALLFFAANLSIMAIYIFLTYYAMKLFERKTKRNKYFKGEPMYFSGIIFGLISFLIIGLFHPLIIFVEYHFGTRTWPIFLIVGIALCILSLFIENIILNVMFGLIAFCGFWSIKELFQQRKRVERGWFPQKKATREIKLLTQEKFTEK